MQVWLNGKLVPKDEATVSVYDHGFLYGDGVFEGIRVYGGCVFKLEEHIDRLYESAKTIGLEIPMDREEMIRATCETVAANRRKDVYIRLVVSRGFGDLGIGPAKCAAPTVVIICDSIALYPDEFYRKGVPLVTAATRRVPTQCVDPRVKSLNYLNNILAKIEARNAGVPEAIMLNTEGHVAECTADNIFLVKRGALKTPDLMQGALAGITRATVIDIARDKGMHVDETKLGLHDFYNADEVFLTGSGAEIVPVVTIDRRTIGSGQPGPITLDLLDEFRKVRTVIGRMVDYDAVPA